MDAQELILENANILFVPAGPRISGKTPLVNDMNISALPSMPVQTQSSNMQVDDIVSIKVLKESMDIQEQTATQLIASVSQSLPQPSAGLGGNLDVYA